MVIIMGAGIMVQAVGEGIGAVGCPWFMEKADVVITEGKNIAGEMVVDLLGAAIVLKVLVISEDVYDKLGS